jgi:hypothetical protein
MGSCEAMERGRLLTLEANDLKVACELENTFKLVIFQKLVQYVVTSLNQWN